MKLTVEWYGTDWLTGFSVITGVALTLRTAAVVVADPVVLVKTARYKLPFWLAVVVKLSVVDVAPEILAKVVPPSVLTCH